ncbi:gastric triacylglycerol lipase, partial [Nephila pilipes]
MAEYDLPAMIDYVLNVTNENQLAYVGHSQGTTAAFALLSEKPEYNKKMKLFIALAPVASGTYISSAVRFLAPFAKDLQ